MNNQSLWPKGGVCSRAELYQACPFLSRRFMGGETSLPARGLKFTASSLDLACCHGSYQDIRVSVVSPEPFTMTVSYYLDKSTNPQPGLTVESEVLP